VSIEIGFVLVHVFVLVPLAVVVVMVVVMVVMSVSMPVAVMVVLVIDDLLAVARPRLMVALDIVTIAIAVAAFLLVRVFFVHGRVSAC
jgi:hypothetical protein